MKITKSYKFKILPTDEQRKFLNDYFIRFAKAVNFYIRAIKNMRKDYEWLSKSQQFEGECNDCGEKQLIVYKFISEKEHFLCPKCWNLRVGDRFIRKYIYATRKRKRGKYDVRDAVKISGTECNLAAKRAIDTIKSNKKQIGKIRKAMKFTKERLKMWREVFEDSKSRFVVPRLPNQKVDRWKHIKLKDDPSRGKTETQIKKEIAALEKTLTKLERRTKTSDICFDGSIVDLQNSAVKGFDENSVEITLDRVKQKFHIALANIKNKKSRQWLLGILRKIKQSKPTYPLLLQDKKSGEFYLSYPVNFEVEEPKLVSNTKVMGIDRGVHPSIAVSVILDQKDGKPHHITFHPDTLMSKKIKCQLIRKKFTGKKNVNRRRRKFGRRVSHLSNYILHTISHAIIEQAKKNMPIAIVMEDLQLIPGAKRVKRFSAKTEKRINYLLSNFVYGKLQALLKYKALEVGIPIIFVKPEYTSQQCYKCLTIGERNGGYFKCLNPNCGHTMNADLNAAINIANRGFDLLTASLE